MDIAAEEIVTGLRRCGEFIGRGGRAGNYVSGENGLGCGRVGINGEVMGDAAIRIIEVNGNLCTGRNGNGARVECEILGG
jgi:hypothetical protein